MSERIATVDLDLLDVRDQKHRLKLDIPAIAESILNSGQINPITVRKVGDRYRIISGRRRSAALKYIQSELTPDKKIKALVYIKNVTDLQEELITIDENIMRQQLDDIDFDEAIYRRKQIYEQLHPETKQHVAGGVGKNQKTQHKKSSPTFTKDAAKKLSVSRRTIEKSVSRAAKASDAVKRARAEGLKQSKVDLLVTLEPKDQDILLPFINKMDLSDTKDLLKKAHKHGAKAAVLYLREETKEDPKLKSILREAEKIAQMLKEATSGEMVFCGDTKFHSVKKIEALKAQIDNFLNLQKEKMGFIRGIVRRDGASKFIRASRVS
jgi:ParB family chromosome partitioning protein